MARKLTCIFTLVLMLIPLTSVFASAPFPVPSKAFGFVYPNGKLAKEGYYLTKEEIIVRRYLNAYHPYRVPGKSGLVHQQTRGFLRESRRFTKRVVRLTELTECMDN